MKQAKKVPKKGVVRYWRSRAGKVYRGVIERTSKTSLPLMRQRVGEVQFERKPHAMCRVHNILWPIWVPLEALYSRRADVL